jgi:hypothetical protein
MLPFTLLAFFAGQWETRGWRRSTVLVALGVSACGRTSLDDHALVEGARDAGPSVPPARGAARCEFDLATDGTALVPADPRQPALVAIDGGQLFLVHADGSVSTLYTLGRLPGEDAGNAYVDGGLIYYPPPGAIDTVSARGNRVAARASAIAARFPSYDYWLRWDEARLLDLDGAVVWQRSFSASRSGPNPPDGVSLFLSGDDWLAAAGPALGATSTPPSATLLVSPDGHEDRLVGWLALAPPFSGPVVAVRNAGGAGGGWWQPTGSEVVALEQPGSVDPAFAFADRLVYVATADANRILVSERVAPPHDAVSTNLATDIVATAPPGWVLLASSLGADGGTSLARFDALTGAVAQPMPIYPAGFRALGGAAAASVDADGSIVMPLRNDYTAGVFRFSPGSTDWSLIGRTMGQVESVQVTARSGTFVIEALGTNGVFVPTQVWNAPAPPGDAPELLQSSTQVVRPDTGESHVLPAMHPVVSEDGLCVAYGSPATTWSVLNMINGKSWSIAGQYQAVVWIE